MMTWAFRPSTATAHVDATTSTGYVALPAGSYRQLRVYNDGTVKAFLAWGTSSAVTAAVTDMPLAPGDLEILSPPAGSTYVAVIMATGTATIYFTGGEGL